MKTKNKIICALFIGLFTFAVIGIGTAEASPVCTPDGINITPLSGTIVLSQNSNITVTYNCSASAWNDGFGLSSPNYMLFGYRTGTAVGATFNAGYFAQGTELIFFLTNPGGNTWYNGPASRNSDNIIHADVRALGNNTWQIGFEDSPSLSIDHDYNDVQITVTATSACTTHTSKQCVGNSVYWFNSCNTQEGIFQVCSTNQTCNNGSCVDEDVECDSASDCGTSGYIGSNFCKNGDVYKSYRTYVCHNAGTSTSYCSNTSEDRLTDNCDADQTCSGGSCEDDNHNNCDSHDYKQCSGNYLYWYDSCGVREDTYQYCSNGCYNNACQNGCSNNSCQNNCTGYNCNNNNNCVNFSYKQCVGNNIYWYDSCGVQRDIYQTCYGSNICQNGACITVQPIQPIYPTYTAHYRTSCYGNNIYWYDSLGGVNSVYKNCADTNSCTIDACSGIACTNTLKCDGTTCAVSSADYNTYCKSGSNTENSSILFSLFAKKDALAVQWDKSVEVKSNETAYFLMTVENNSQDNIQSVRVSADIPLEITSLGNLKVNDVSVAGDIVAGIDVGPLAKGVLKRVTFEGKSGVITSVSAKQVNAKVEFNGISQPDSLSVNFSTATVAGALTEAKASSGIVEFLKRWYIWILGLLVLIFLFVVVFRRLSSN